MIGLALISLAGACLTIAGLAPENVSPDAHATTARIGPYLLNAAVLQIGISLVHVSRVAGVLGLMAAVTGWVGTGLLFGAATAVPVGLSERLADYPGTAVLVAIGAVGAVVGHQRLLTRNPGVVHRDPQSSELLSSGNHLLQLLGVGHVDREWLGSASRGGNLGRYCLRPRSVQIGHQYAGSAPSEGLSTSLTDAGAGSSDNRSPVFEVVLSHGTPSHFPLSVLLSGPISLGDVEFAASPDVSESARGATHSSPV